MSKYLVIALVVALIGAAGMSKLYVGAREARAVAEAVNKQFAEQIKTQEQQKADLVETHKAEVAEINRSAADMAEWRKSLLDEVRTVRDNTEGAAALISDDDWWCASEPVSAVFLDSLRQPAADNDN